MFKNRLIEIGKVKFSPKRVFFLLRRIGRYLRFQKEFFEFKRLSKKYHNRFSVKILDQFPCLYDRTENTGFEPHYTYHPAWAARIVKEINPKYHVDISSTLSFCTIVSAFVPVAFYDYRPAKLKNLSGLICERADLTNLHFETDSVESLSCMHTIEHIGLARYGDKMDPDGDLKAINELRRVVAKGGSLIFVVPVGRPRIQFNSHRTYSYEQIIEYFPDMELKEFSLIPDNYLEHGLIRNASMEIVKNQEYGCGCFWFIKK